MSNMFLAVMLPFLPHLAGAQEVRTIVAVLDSGLNVDSKVAPYLCEQGVVDLTGRGPKDEYGHGTNIVGIIAKQLDPTKECILAIKWFHSATDWTMLRKDEQSRVLANAVKIAQLRGAKYLNMSSWGVAHFDEEEDAIAHALFSGVKVFVAAGNGGQDLEYRCNSYPACYPISREDFHVVANYCNQLRSPHSNFHGPVTDLEDGENVEGFGIVLSGTSQATAVRLAKEVVRDRSH